MKHDETSGSREGLTEGLTTEELARPRMDADPDTAETTEGRPAYPGDAVAVDDATTTGAPPDLGEGKDRPDPADTSGLTAAAARTDREDREDREDGEDREDREDRMEADAAGAETAEPDATPLMPESQAAEFRDEWSRIQGEFVDDPKESVRAADGLVAAVMQQLAGTFASHKEELEQQWSSGGEVATEDLRLALQRYRSFFNRLLST
ncbi:hypothetical protein ACFVGY_07985 [Streptomyces sp. NPDC127106]|uniref:hypothetical protein n=1 Tax=Streptomyces sp. NPDC127106 TaxID=3345360 RepID=UPI00363B1EFF